MAGAVLEHVSVIPGDITQQHVDVIVNAANATLFSGGLRNEPAGSLPAPARISLTCIKFMKRG